MKLLLSATIEDPALLTYPKLASPKLDGIRCVILEGQAYSRNMKLIPNQFIQRELSCIKHGLDGELIVGDPKAPDCYRRTNSGVMSVDGKPEFTFWVFDLYQGDLHFSLRLKWVQNYVKSLENKRVRHVPHVNVADAAALAEYEAKHLIAGYEGVMVRDPAGVYKEGRSTLRDGILGKLKRFCDGEARIEGFDEQMHNGNEATKDELGRTKRSSHQSGKTGKGTLGALKVVDTQTGVHFDIGTGFTDLERQTIWDSQPSWMGSLVKYKSLPVGVKDKPRHPVYLGTRLDI